MASDVEQHMPATSTRTRAALLIAAAMSLVGCGTPEGEHETPPMAGPIDAIEWLGGPAAHPERKPLARCGSRDVDASAVQTSVLNGISVRITYASRTGRSCAMFQVPRPVFVNRDDVALGTLRGGSGHPAQPVNVVVTPSRPAVQDVTWTRPCSGEPNDSVRILMTDDELEVDGIGALPTCPDVLAYDENRVAITPLRPDAGSPDGWPLELVAHSTTADGLILGVHSLRGRFRLDPCPDIWLWREGVEPPQGFALNCAGVDTLTGDGTPYLDRAGHAFLVPMDSSVSLRAVSLVGVGESRLQVNY